MDVAVSTSYLHAESHSWRTIQLRCSRQLARQMLARLVAENQKNSLESPNRRPNMHGR